MMKGEISYIIGVHSPMQGHVTICACSRYVYTCLGRVVVVGWEGKALLLQEMATESGTLE